MLKYKQNRRFSSPMLLLWGTFYFNFLLNLRQSPYFSRVHRVEAINLSPLPLFYDFDITFDYKVMNLYKDWYWFNDHKTQARAVLHSETVRFLSVLTLRVPSTLVTTRWHLLGLYDDNQIPLFSPVYGVVSIVKYLEAREILRLLHGIPGVSQMLLICDFLHWCYLLGYLNLKMLMFNKLVQLHSHVLNIVSNTMKLWLYRYADRWNAQLKNLWTDNVLSNWRSTSYRGR
jgi:hypothetical protein